MSNPINTTLSASGLAGTVIEPIDSHHYHCLAHRVAADRPEATGKDDLRLTAVRIF